MCDVFCVGLFFSVLNILLLFQLDVKKSQSIIKIQAIVRGFLNRKRIRKSRENYLVESYANGQGILTLPQLSHQIVSFYFLNQIHSTDILVISFKIK